MIPSVIHGVSPKGVLMRGRVTAAEEGVSVPKLILKILDDYTKGVRVERSKRKGEKR
jgi:hypothetical protein